MNGRDGGIRISWRSFTPETLSDKLEESGDFRFSVSGSSNLEKIETETLPLF
jgi:hypothetical protein